VVHVSFAQEKTVTGIITDQDGLPLPATTVLVKGTTNGTSSDFDGNYSIKANQGDVLVYSFVGYKSKEVVVGASSTINVTLAEDAEALAEVIITARSIFDVGNEIDNGVSAMSSEDLKTVVNTVSIDRALQGNLAGVNVVSANQAPGATANVIVRGAFSPTGGLQNPLYVVDGTYMNAEDLVSVNSNNIESVQVLTDASQTALYGSRGANGVVIITTKRGKKGEASITLNTRSGWSNRFPIRTPLMNSRQKLEYENKLAGVVNPVTGNPLGLGVARTAAEIDELAQIDNPWEDILYNTGLSSSYNLSITNGSDNSTNRFSLGYDSEEGIVEGYEGFQRISASLGNNTTINESLNFGYTVSGAYSVIDDPRDRRNVQSPFWSELNNNPYATLYVQNPDGSFVLDDRGERIFNRSGINSFGYQVLDEVFGTDQERRNLRIFGSAFFEALITPELKVRTQIGANYDRTQNENFLRPSALLNSFIGTQGTKSDVSSDRLDYNWRNEITYAKSFGDHNMSATVASEYTKDNFYRIELNGRTFPNDFQNTQNLAGTIDPDSETSRFGISRFGYIGALKYNFANKYFINGYFRRDGSSLAGLDNQYGNFFGASVAWDIAKESFMDSADWVNSLKFAGSWGTLGNDNVLGLYSNFTTISTAGVLYGNNPAAIPSVTVANPNATWETNEKFNVGIAFELLQNSRLRGKIDYFTDTRSDFLFEQEFAFESGSYTSFINAGESKTSGWEFDLSYDIFRNPDGFNLTVFGNITGLEYEITDLVQDQFLIAFPGGQVVHEVGLEPFTFNLVRYVGVDPSNGDALYLDSDDNVTNVFSAQDAVPIEGKSVLPEFFGGFGLNASYKGFDISTNFNYSAGNYVYNLTALNSYDFGGSSARNNRFVGAENFWTQPGDTNVLPRPTVNGLESNSTQFLQDASYLAWRNLTLGYTLDGDALRNVPINFIRMYVQAQGLAIWSGFDGNPEIGDGSTEDNNAVDVAGAYSAYTYPRVRSFNFGVDINF
jgi:TonB-linked SusC/RagA family outer membrane protein